MNVLLTINLDEVSSSITDSLRFLYEIGMPFCELRMINGRNLSHLKKDECIHLAHILQNYSIKAISIASPLFKWYSSPMDKGILHDNFGINPYLSDEGKRSLIDQTFTNAHLLSVRYIRIFSELGEESSTKIDEFLNNRLFEYTLKKAIDEDIILLLENEPVCKIHSLPLVIEFLKRTAGYSENLRLWLDISNALEIGDVLRDNALSEICSRLSYLHLKDFFRRGQSIEYVPIGEGIIDYPSVLRRIWNLYKNLNVNPLVMSVETHAPTTELKLPYSKKSLNAVNQIIKEF